MGEFSTLLVLDVTIDDEFHYTYLVNLEWMQFQNIIFVYYYIAEKKESSI